MTAWLADVGTGMVIAIVLVVFAGVMLLGQIKDPRNARHPEGRKGRLRDEFLSMAAFIPMLLMIVAGAFGDTLRGAGWWLPVLFTLTGLAIAGTFLPPVWRARKRLEALRGHPPQ